MAGRSRSGICSRSSLPPAPLYCIESFGAWQAVPVGGIVTQTATIAWLGN
ncbi:MAG TPA: hypothetical protein VIF09_04985 [Polyangiaceae bacterium]|jgi:hypothetical protein